MHSFYVRMLGSAKFACLKCLTNCSPISQYSDDQGPPYSTSELGLLRSHDLFYSIFSVCCFVLS